MTAAPPPSWYPDPFDQGQLRWWDGARWTEHLHELPPDAAQPEEDSSSETPSPRQQEPAATAPVQPRQWTLPIPVAPPARNRQPKIIGLAVLAVLAIAAIAFVLTRGDGSGDVVLQEPATTSATATTTSGATTTATTQPPVSSVATTADALAGSTFSDPTNVYRLRVAPTWQDATVTGGLQTWATGTGSSIFRDSVNVLVEKLPIDISMDNYLAASAQNAPRSLPSFVEVGRSVNTVSGKVLGQLDYRSNQNTPLRHRAVVLIKGRNAIVVTYTSQPDRFDAESLKVQPYLTSVEGV